MGRNYRSHLYWSPEGRGTFKQSRDFYDFFGWRFDGKLLRRRAIDVAGSRFFQGYGGRRLVHGRDCGNIAPIRSIFGGGRA
jgi:hypothetical protein